MTPTTALDIAQALVRLPSVNPDYDPASAGEGAATQWIEDWGRAHGFSAWRQPVLPGRENVFLQFRNGADHPHFMLNGHTDTVGVGGMTIEPFSGEVRDGRLWGRGASDMKGPLACMLAAALRLKNAPSTWHGTLTVACMADEEFRFRGVTAMLEQLVGRDCVAPPSPVGRDSVEPHLERSEASAASISGEVTPTQETRSARASFVGRWGSTESHPTKLGKEARRG